MKSLRVDNDRLWERFLGGTELGLVDCSRPWPDRFSFGTLVVGHWVEVARAFERLSGRRRAIRMENREC